MTELDNTAKLELVNLEADNLTKLDVTALQEIKRIVRIVYCADSGIKITTKINLALLFKLRQANQEQAQAVEARTELNQPTYTLR